jgi:hypothetical protein
MQLKIMDVNKFSLSFLVKYETKLAMTGCAFLCYYYLQLEQR